MGIWLSETSVIKAKIIHLKKKSIIYYFRNPGNHETAQKRVSLINPDSHFIHRISHRRVSVLLLSDSPTPQNTMEKQEPKPSRTDPSGKAAAQSFQRLKYWIDLTKWFIASVVLVTVTTIINWGFRDREAGLAELKFYDRYVTELIVLNPNPVQKRMLAQYFASVTPSEKLRERWEIYYDSVYIEYREYIDPLLKEDSLIRMRYQRLLQRENLSDAATGELIRMKERMDQIDRLLHPLLTLPAGTNELPR
ncbi:MAG: hypothetical protein V1733_08755, partial [bacterium]